MQHTLERASNSLEDVVRVTMYTKELKPLDEIGSVQMEFFGKARPAATMVEVKRLAHLDLPFEAEVAAVAAGSG